MAYSKYKLIILYTSTLQLYYTVEDSHTWINEHRKINVCLENDTERNDYAYNTALRYLMSAGILTNLIGWIAVILFLDVLLFIPLRNPTHSCLLVTYSFFLLIEHAIIYNAVYSNLYYIDSSDTYFKSSINTYKYVYSKYFYKSLSMSVLSCMLSCITITWDLIDCTIWFFLIVSDLLIVNKVYNNMNLVYY